MSIHKVPRFKLVGYCTDYRFGAALQLYVLRILVVVDLTVISRNHSTTTTTHFRNSKALQRFRPANSSTLVDHPADVHAHVFQSPYSVFTCAPGVRELIELRVLSIVSMGTQASRMRTRSTSFPPDMITPAVMLRVMSGLVLLCRAGATTTMVISQSINTGLGDIGDGKWVGFALALNTNKLYAAPGKAEAVLIVDPTTNAVDITTLGGFGSGFNKWYGIAFAPVTGKLYAAPTEATQVLVIDPLTNTTAMLSGNLGIGAKWWGIAFAPIVNRLYAAPYDAPNVLVVNPFTNATTLLPVSLGGMGAKWVGIVYVSTTNMLYAAPSGADSVLIVNPSTNTVDTTSLAGLGTVVSKWRGLAYAPNVGKLVIVPHHAAAVLVVDPLTVTMANVSLGVINGSVQGFGGARFVDAVFCSLTNKVYAPPWDANFVLEFDPTTNVSTGIYAGSGRRKWAGAAVVNVSGTTSIYGTPFFSSDVLVLTPSTTFPTSSPTLVPSTMFPTSSPITTRVPTAHPATASVSTSAPTITTPFGISTMAPTPRAPTASGNPLGNGSGGGGGSGGFPVVIIIVGALVAVLLVFAIGVYIGRRNNRSKGQHQDPSLYDKPQVFMNVAYQDAFYEQPVATNPDYAPGGHANAAGSADEGWYDTYEAGDQSSAATKDRVHVDSDNYVESRDMAVRGTTSTDTPPQGQYEHLSEGGIYATPKLRDGRNQNSYSSLDRTKPQSLHASRVDGDSDEYLSVM